MSKTYAQLAREIAALQASAQKQLAIESKDAVVKINDLIAKYKLAAGDLTFASSAAASVKPAAPSKAPKGRSATSAKRTQYSDGKGNVWGGRGPRPAWLRGAIAAGRAIESFLTGAAPTPVASPALAKKVVAKSAASKRVVAKPAAAPAAVAAKKLAPAPKSSAIAATVKTAAKKGPAKKAATKKAPAAKQSMPALKTAQAASAVQKTSAAKSAAAPTPAASTPAVA